MPKRRYLVSIAFISAICLFLSDSSAFAVLTMNVSQPRGGNIITFGTRRGSNNIEEARIQVTITNDRAEKYQIYQIMTEPLRRQDGVELDLNNVLFSTISGTGTSGTLMAETPQAASMANAPLYTSNGTGTADSFDILYTLNMSGNINPGNYYGRITYLARPDSGATSIVQVTMSVYAYIESSGELVISVAPEGGKALRLDENSKAKDVVVKITGPLESGYQIRQHIRQPVMSQENIPFPSDGLIYSVRQASGAGSVTTASGNIGDDDKVLYVDNTGKECELTVSFSLKTEGLKAGTYSTELQYLSESLEPGKTMRDIVNVVIEITPVFDIEVAAEGGAPLMEYRDLKPDEISRSNRAALKIRTNRGRPYQVSQIVSGELISQDGQRIPKDYFTVTAEPVNARGRIVIGQNSPVQEGETAIYVSDNDGEPAELALSYDLKIPKGTRAGNYAAQIKYSISEL